MIDKLFNSLKKTAENNLKVLPKLEEFPIHDQTILAVYNQTYIITLIGLPTSSLIMQGVLMEMFVKFLYFHHKKQEFKRELWELIKTCYKENLFSHDNKRNEVYYKFFDNFRGMIRNVQTHFLAKNKHKDLE